MGGCSEVRPDVAEASPECAGWLGAVRRCPPRPGGVRIAERGWRNYVSYQAPCVAHGPPRRAAGSLGPTTGAPAACRPSRREYRADRIANGGKARQRYAQRLLHPVRSGEPGGRPLLLAVRLAPDLRLWRARRRDAAAHLPGA